MMKFAQYKLTHQVGFLADSRLESHLYTNGELEYKTTVSLCCRNVGRMSLEHGSKGNYLISNSDFFV
jgi:hypothetical protein